MARKPNLIQDPGGLRGDPQWFTGVIRRSYGGLVPSGMSQMLSYKLYLKSCFLDFLSPSIHTWQPHEGLMLTDILCDFTCCIYVTKQSSLAGFYPTYKQPEQ